jgi:hypothetical protein
VVTLLSKEVTLPANDEENVVEVLFTSVMLAAKEELFVFMELWRVSILVAAEELLVVIVLFIVPIDEFNDAEVLTNEELSDVILNASEELAVVDAALTSVMDAAKEALSKEPVPAAAAAIVSILPAKDELAFVNVVFTVVIDAANDALLDWKVLFKLFMLIAVLELLVVTVEFREVISDFNEEDAA